MPWNISKQDKQAALWKQQKTGHEISGKLGRAQVILYMLKRCWDRRDLDTSPKDFLGLVFPFFLREAGGSDRKEKCWQMEPYRELLGFGTMKGFQIWVLYSLVSVLFICLLVFKSDRYYLCQTRNWLTDKTLNLKYWLVPFETGKAKTHLEPRRRNEPKLVPWLLT